MFKYNEVSNWYIITLLQENNMSKYKNLTSVWESEILHHIIIDNYYIPLVDICVTTKLSQLYNCHLT